VTAAALLAGAQGVAEGASAPTTPSPARVTFGLEPASATGADGRPALTYSVTPGAVVFDHVAALNYSAQPLTLQLYAGDAVETSTGGYGVQTAGTASHGVGKWVSIPPQDATVTVPARSALAPGEVVVPLTVHIPLNVSPGDHSGAIVLSLSTTGKSPNGQDVVLQQRVGTRVQILVAGPVTPKLEISDVHASYAGTANPVGRGKVHLSYVLTNNGNENLGVTVTAGVSGLLGSASHTPAEKIAVLFPGATLAGSAEMNGVWPQLLEHVSVTGSAHVLVTGRAPVLAPVTASATVWAVPWTLLLIVAIVLAAAVFLVWRRRRRPPAGPPTPESDAVDQSTAKAPVAA
jgi:hypothetical protein